MALSRILEPEVMDSHVVASDYDEMDHSAVNQQFVEDLIAAGVDSGDILDLGTGTALIPVELCKRLDECRVMAVDLSIPMLEVARYNVEIGGFVDRIVLAQVDGKELPYRDEYFEVVISNSIVHHVPEPGVLLREAARVAQRLVFFRDLIRPVDQAHLEELVHKYAGHDSDSQQKMFSDSLHAALTVDEVRAHVQEMGFDPASVQATSDRHWTWILRK